MGWMQGSNLGERAAKGPFRNGVKRAFDADDYRAVVEIAKAAGVRIQAVFILCELDRKNILSKYPTTTWQRERWDNSANISGKQLECIDYVRSQSAWLEFGFHGIGHEHWPADGVRKRAEFYNLEDDHPWPEETLRGHFAAAKEILGQYDLTPARGHSFPETFMPGCYSYYWNPSGDYSLGKLLSENGVRYANTNFTFIPELRPPEQINAGGFDYGVHVLGRLNYGNLWYELDSLPKTPLSMQPTDIAETHWANWLAPDNFLQPATNKRWIDYYAEVSSMPDRYAARNTAQLHSQWLYRNFASVTATGPGELTIDNSRMPAEAYAKGAAGNLVLRILRQGSEKLSACSLNGDPLVPVFFETAPFIDLYLPVLKAETYTFRFELGEHYPDFAVPLSGTCNVLNTTSGAGTATLDVRLYGRQEINLICSTPAGLRTDSKEITIHKSRYDAASRILVIDLEAADFQGVSGKIFIDWDH